MPGRREALLRAVVAPACVVVAGSLAWAGRGLPQREPELARRAIGAMEPMGVANPVTAVLLDFRGYDTLLEMAVLLLALVAARGLPGGGWTASGMTYGRADAAPEPVLAALAGVVAPVGVVVAGYLWWAGSHAPGGAFQAGSVLGALGVLLLLGGRIAPNRFATGAARAGAAAGLLIFTGVGLALMTRGRAFLDYPEGATYQLIIAIEGVLTVSIGVVLAALFAATYDEPQARTGR